MSGLALTGGSTADKLLTVRKIENENRKEIS